MEHLIYFLTIILVTFLLQYFMINKRAIKNNKYENMVAINYLMLKFRLDPKKNKIKRLSLITAIINSIIVAFTSMIVIVLDMAFGWRMLIGFAVLFLLIYSIYEILGRVLLKRGKKNV